MSNEMRVYVGTYAKYKAGNLSGGWLDIEDYADKEGFYEACKKLHADETDPEFMFQAVEGIPSEMVSESYISDEVFEFALMSDDDQDMLAAYRQGVDDTGTLEEARDAFRRRGVSRKGKWPRISTKNWIISTTCRPGWWATSTGEASSPIWTPPITTSFTTRAKCGCSAGFKEQS